MVLIPGWRRRSPSARRTPPALTRGCPACPEQRLNNRAVIDHRGSAMAELACHRLVDRHVAPRLHSVMEQVHSSGKLRADAPVGDAAAGDSGGLYPLAVRPGEGAGRGSTDVARPSPARPMWARGSADRARGQFVQSVAAGLDSSVMPALEHGPGHRSYRRVRTRSGVTRWAWSVRWCPSRTGSFDPKPAQITSRILYVTSSVT